jgi:hypothetical protein
MRRVAESNVVYRLTLYGQVICTHTSTLKIIVLIFVNTTTFLEGGFI